MFSLDEGQVRFTVFVGTRHIGTHEPADASVEADATSDQVTDHVGDTSDLVANQDQDKESR